MLPISELTYKVVAFTVLPDYDMDEAVSWAYEMVALGFETPSLLILAGLEKPVNYYEAASYLKNTINELGLELKTGDEAIICYSSYYIKRIAQNSAVKENLWIIYNFLLKKDYDKSIYDFYLLYWAWGDLDYGNEYQEYWPEATKNNIEEIVIKEAQKWLEKNEEVIELKIN